MREKNVAKYFRDTPGQGWWLAVSGWGEGVTCETDCPGLAGAGRAGGGDVPGPGDQSVCEQHQPGHNIANCVMFCKTQRERENSLTCDCDLRRRSFGEKNKALKA